MKNKKLLVIGSLALLLGVILMWRAELLPQEQSQEQVSDTEQSVVTVKRVIDGDTFELENGERVRLLGIDTPEKGKFYFDEASQRMKNLVEGRQVVLVKDISETDKYGRLLRHVYVDDVWINEQMITEGYARFVTIPPDVMHIDNFRTAQKQAFAHQVGLWSKENN